MKRSLSAGAAVAWLVAAAWFPAGGCLNPRPEELPPGAAPDYAGETESDDPGDSTTPLAPAAEGPPTPEPSPGASEPPPSPIDEGSGPADAGVPEAGRGAPDSRDDVEPPPETGEPPE
jgi:hypothetical protein